MRIRRLSSGNLALLCTTCFAVGACSATSDDQSEGDHPFGADRRAVYVENDMSDAPRSTSEWQASTVCELAYYADGGAGFFRVDEVVGVAEQDRSAPVDAWTYVRLTLLEDWSGSAPESIVLRVHGGPLNEEEMIGLRVKFVEGEEAGILIKGAESDENAGFATTAEHWVWRQTPDGLSQGAEGDPVAREEIAALFRAAYDALPDVDHPLFHQCPVQIPWEDCPEETLVPEDAPRFFDAEPCDGTTADAGAAGSADAGGAE